MTLSGEEVGAGVVPLVGAGAVPLWDAPRQAGVGPGVSVQDPGQQVKAVPLAL